LRQRMAPRELENFLRAIRDMLSASIILACRLPRRRGKDYRCMEKRHLGNGA
jgi:hypothetical protein